MASNLKNLSVSGEVGQLLRKEKLRIGIVYAEWNENITVPMKDAAIKTLLENGILNDNIIEIKVPGTFELPLAAQYLLEYSQIDSVICIGCVIQGETKHFDFICQGVTNGITDLNLKFNKPVIFGVLTTNNLEQAIDRSGGKHGNKGIEAAITALKMISVKQTILNK